MAEPTSTLARPAAPKLPEPPRPPLPEAVRGTAVVVGPPIAADLGILASLVVLVRWMRGNEPRSRAVRVAALIGSIIPVAYVLLVRRRLMRWGASDEEVAAPMLGDELVPEPGIVSTRAITVDAPAERVWPWLAQLGQDRGGFYSYTWLENLAGAGITNADQIQPEWQEPRRVGEVLHMAPNAGDVVAAYDPGHAMVLHNWGTLAVEPIDEERSRVIVRTRGRRGLAGAFLSPLLGEVPHFIMERRMLRGIRERAEAAAAQPVAGKFSHE